MESAPPSYNEATLVDHWDLVARYIPSSDLCAASLVCRRWHATFIPQLWGNPASHFGTENDRVYTALIRFKRTLQTARLLVRSLTHTLHLPPAQAELYSGLRDDWLREILDRLPNLQSLVVRGLSFFDHAALQALKTRPPAQAQEPSQRYAPRAGVIELPASMGSTFQTPTSTIPTFGLRLLDASRCPNVTSKGLAQALGRFESLLYLDFSYTTAARDQGVLAVLRKFSGLQVLKLRGIGLRDEEAEMLAKAIGLRVRSLDVRNNRISDVGARMLLEHCFKPSAGHAQGSKSGQHLPEGPPYMGSEMLRIYQGTEFETYLRKAFTGSFVSKLTIEDAPEGGITHLYIADNYVTVDAVAALVGSGRLHCLDEGPLGASARHQTTMLSASSTAESTTPHVEKLTGVLSGQVKDNLRFLRIDHRLITEAATKTDSRKTEAGHAGLPGYSTVFDSGRTTASAGGEGSQPSLAAPALHSTRKRSYSSVVKERQERLTSHCSRFSNLHPAMLPHVGILVLTDVPKHSLSGQGVHAIIEFIKTCAEETHLARTQASLDWSLPPGRRGQLSALKSSAEELFALKRIVLEMAPEQEPHAVSNSWHSTQSMTEDRDSETLWSAAESDFSFFGEDEESDVPSLDPESTQNQPRYGWKSANGSSGSRPEGSASSQAPAYDTIALLSDFRKGRKLAHQRQVSNGEFEPYTEGYWDGIVSVVRPGSGDPGPDGEYDYYGNTFTGWGLYR